MRCETCALCKPQAGDRPASCMSKVGPFRGWYVEPHNGCAEWHAKET